MVPRLSPSVGFQPPDQCCCPLSTPQPLPRPVHTVSLAQRVLGGCSVTVQAVWPWALSVCVLLFVKVVLFVVATPLPQTQPNLSSRPACTLLHGSGVSAPHSNPAVRPSQQRPWTQ